MWLENKIARIVTELTEGLRKTCFEIKMAQFVTEPRDCLSKT